MTTLRGNAEYLNDSDYLHNLQEGSSVCMLMQEHSATALSFVQEHEAVPFRDGPEWKSLVNEDLTVYVDSGSDVCLMRRSVLRRLGAEVHPIKTNIMGVDSNKTNIDEVAFVWTIMGAGSDSSCSRRLAFYVFPDDGHETHWDVICGVDTQRAFGMAQAAQKVER